MIGARGSSARPICIKCDARDLGVNKGDEKQLERLTGPAAASYLNDLLSAETEYSIHLSQPT
jgi:hypothetical protein